VEVDYLSDLDGSAGLPKHSHLPQQAALDMVGDALKNAPVDCLSGVCKGVHVHFDVGPSTYQGDPYVITGGTGGNPIPESALVCTDVICQFPGQPAVGWKGGLLFVQSQAALGNFQPARALSYRYALFGHSLGDPRSFWSTLGTQLSDPTFPQLVSIVVTPGNTATVTLQSPSLLLPTGGFIQAKDGVIKPGDCPNVAIPVCSDLNTNRIT